VRDVEIAQAALAVSDIGLEQVDRAAVALVPLADLRREPLEKTLQIAWAEDAFEGAREHLFRRPGVARDGPPVEQSRGRRQIAASEVEHVAEGHDRMADGETGVPERIEQRLGDRPSALSLARTDEAHVEIAVQRDGAAPVAADGRERARVPRALALHRGAHGAKQGT
jgi:hypothetical protein